MKPNAGVKKASADEASSVKRIPLSATSSGTPRAYALVDDEDYERLSAYTWCLFGRGYVMRRLRVSEGQRGEYVLLHREILGLTKGDGLQADHINRNRLDNRRQNLRVVTHAENNQNLAARGMSRYRGVTWSKRRGHWVATVRERYLGSYATELEAARAAARYRAEHMPFSVEDPSLLRDEERAA